MREAIERSLEQTLRWALYFTLFLLPFKFGVPYLEQETFLFPYSFQDWIILPYWPLEFFNFLPLALFFLWGLKCFFGGRWVIRWNLGLTAALLFLGAAMASNFFSVYPYASKLLSQQIASYVLLFFLSLQLLCVENGGMEKAAAWFSAGATLLALYALYQHFFGLRETLEWIQKGGLADKLPADVIHRLQGGRAFATFIYPNSLAGYLLLAFPISLSLSISQWRTQRSSYFIFCGLLAGASLLFIFTLGMERSVLIPGAIAGSFLYPFSILAGLGVTFSKGGVLSLFLLGLFFAGWSLILRRRETAKRSLLPAVGLAVAILFLAAAFAFYYREFWLHRLQMGTFGFRRGYWNAAARIFSHFPFLGSGPGTFGVLYPLFKSFAAENTQLAHNDPLQIAAETGLVGILLFLFFWGIQLFKGLAYTKSASKKNPILLGIFWGCGGLALHHLGDFDFYVPGLGGCEWIFLGLLSGEIFKTREITTPLPSFVLRVSFLMGILFVTMAAANQLSQQFQSRYAFDVARRTAKAGNLPEALNWAARASEKENGNAVIKIFQGKILAQMGGFQKAIDFYRQAAAADPYWAVPYLLEAQLLKEEWNKTKSAQTQAALLHAWKEAIARHPTQTDTRLELARFLEKLGLLEPALIEYRFILKLDPSNNEAQERARELGRHLADKIRDLV